GAAPTGAYDLQFTLYDASAGGAPVAPSLMRDDVAVTKGLFTVVLDFGAVFAASKRFLEVSARPGSSTGPYMTLSPRQELTATPNALFSATAGTAGTAANFTGPLSGDVTGTQGATHVEYVRGAHWAQI